MIGIWYNPHKKKFYTKYVRTAFIHSYYRVGYVNQYDHQLLALYAIEKGRLIQCDSWNDYYTYKRGYYQFKNIKKRFIKWLIKLLERSVRND